MPSDLLDYFKMIREFIASEEIKEKYKFVSPRIPQQKTDYDCGIFVMEFARNILFKKKITEAMVNDIDDIRKRIRNELLSKKLLFI